MAHRLSDNIDHSERIMALCHFHRRGSLDSCRLHFSLCKEWDERTKALSSVMFAVPVVCTDSRERPSIGRRSRYTTPFADPGSVLIFKFPANIIYGSLTAIYYISNKPNTGVCFWYGPLLLTRLTLTSLPEARPSRSWTDDPR